MHSRSATPARGFQKKKFGEIRGRIQNTNPRALLRVHGGTLQII
jgi:hypothetical protein